MRSYDPAMTYADGRIIFDADSHVMELPAWLGEFADPEIRERLRPLETALGRAGGKAAESAVADATARAGAGARFDDEQLRSQLLTRKGWHAIGAFDSAERSRVLDALGFHAQLVFSTFAPTQYAGDDSTLLIGGTRAHNRAMAAFCADDPRLLAVGFVPWLTPELTLQLTSEAIDEGCRVIHLPSVPGRGVSPTHPDHDPLWRLLEERGIPMVQHIGSGGRPLPKQFHDNGLLVTDFLGGGENVRAKDFMALHMSTELFFSCLILDGVLDRFPGLRVGSIEQGASWVVPWIRRLDQVMSFSRTEQRLRELSLKPSEFVHRQMRFTPWPDEPVGWMIEQAGDDLFLFSSDYPHPEGTKDPIGRFERNLGTVPGPARDRFYAGNFADLLGIAVPAAA
jgi:predicted TIM-barrel fold metal-dependent hydrolase